MPRYAKESLESVIYADILAFADNTGEPTAGYTNPDREMTKGMSGIGFGDRMRAIKSMCRIHELGWITDENAVQVIHNISLGL